MGKPNNNNKPTTSQPRNVPIVEKPTVQKKKYLTKYNPGWAKKRSWLQRRSTDDIHHCWCMLCDSNINVGHEGILAVKKHESTEMHKLKIVQIPGTSVEKAMIANNHRDDIEPHVVLAGVMSYGVVKYQLSHSCQDYISEAIKHVVPLYSSCRDKSRAIIKGAIALSAQEIMLAEIRETPFMSIHFDTSNHCETKMLPIVARYFIPTEGVRVRPIDMVSIIGETAETLSNKIIESIQKVSKYNRDDTEAKVFTLNADNASGNFGGKLMKNGKNVATFLKNHFQRDLIKIGCPAHSCNNAIRNAIGKFPTLYNVQRLCTILYKEFKGNNVRYNKLRLICTKLGLPCLKLLGCSKTRWLSLLPALRNIILMYPALVEYFRLKVLPKKGKCKQSGTFAKLFFKRKDSLAFLEIIKEHAALIHQTVLDIEGNCTTILSAIENLQTLIDTCKEISLNPCFTSTIRTLLGKLSSKNKNQLIKMSKEFYKFTGTYLKSWCKNMFVFKIFSWASILEDAPQSLSSIVDCVDFMKMKNVDFPNEGNLAREFVQVKAFIVKQLPDWNSRKLKTVDRWVELFKSFSSRSIELPNFELITRFVFSISASNAVVERIFSFIKRYWSDSKSNLDFVSMQAAVHSKFSLFSDTSIEKYDSASSVWKRIEDDPVLYNRIKTQGKYHNHLII